jgi:hypothetical protein
MGKPLNHSANFRDNIWKLPLELIVQIAGYLAFPESGLLLLIHPAITLAIKDSIYRRLHLGLLSYEPDLNVSRLATTREIYCAGSTHPVRGGLKLESLELDASGHWPHSCCYLSTFAFRRLTVLYLARPVPMLNDILSCLDLSYIRKITFYPQRFTSYTDSLHLTDNRLTSHIALNVVFPDSAELWPGENDNQMAAFDRFVDQASYLFPKIKIHGYARLFQTEADGSPRSAGRPSLDSQI